MWFVAITLVVTSVHNNVHPLLEVSKLLGHVLTPFCNKSNTLEFVTFVI